MKWAHLSAILWLRWRLSVNRWQRQGAINAGIMVVVVAAALLTSVVSFFVAVVVGVLTLGEAEPDHLLFIWDGLIVAFLFFWLIGVMTELQRSDSLSMDKLLHLPVSPTGTFLLNYLSSLITVTTIVFVPPMLGLCIAQVIVKGPAMLLVFPLVAGFLLMVTAVTYQFRGWLGSLMVNKRRKRTIVALLTFGFILLVQIPNLLNMTVFKLHRLDEPIQQHVQRLDELQAEWDSGAIDAREFQQKQMAETARYAEERKQHGERTYQRVVDTALLVNLALPVGWLAYGARASAQGYLLVGLLCASGTAVIGGFSLRRSFRTTLRYYTGGFNAGRRRSKAKPAAETKSAPDTAKHSARLLERTLGPIPEHAAAVAMASFRGLLRAPEAKMILLSPIIMLVIFGSTLFASGARGAPMALRPLIGIGAITMTMFGLVQLMQNQFGFDRSGFRVYVLSPAPRRHILLGKNLSVAPLGVGICLVSVAVLQLVVPMRWDHLLATLVQIGSFYLILSMVGNLASILVPIALKPDSMAAAQATFLTTLVQFVYMFLFPTLVLPTLLPLGLDLLLEYLGWRYGVPVYLMLAMLELAFLVWLYRHVLRGEGKLLARRERRILETVTAQGR